MEKALCVPFYVFYQLHRFYSIKLLTEEESFLSVAKKYLPEKKKKAHSQFLQGLQDISTFYIFHLRTSMLKWGFQTPF